MKIRNWGLIGVVAGLLALGMALFHVWAGPLEPAPPIEEQVAEKAVAIRDATIAKLKGEEYEAAAANSAWSKDRVFSLATAATALLAIALSVTAFVRREDSRICGSALALGSGAIAFQFMAATVSTLIFFLLVAAVLSALGIDLG